MKYIALIVVESFMLFVLLNLLTFIKVKYGCDFWTCEDLTILLLILVVFTLINIAIVLFIMILFNKNENFRK